MRSRMSAEQERVMWQSGKGVAETDSVSSREVMRSKRELRGEEDHIEWQSGVSVITRREG